MVSKLLRIQVYSLFILALIPLSAVFLGEVFPESYLSINSQSADYSLLRYYIGSFFSFFDFYFGPWLLFPFFCSTISYSFVISKREKKSDVLIPLSFLFFFLTLLNFLGLKLIGPGLLEFYLDNLNLPLRILLFILSAISTYGLLFSFRAEKFKNYFLGSPLVKKFLEFFSKKEKPIQNCNKTEFQIDPKDSPFNLVPQLKMLQSHPFSEGNNLAPPKSDNINLQTAISPIEMKSKIVVNSSVQDDKYYGLVRTLSTKKHSNRIAPPDDNYFLNITTRIEEKLNEFKIEGQILNVLKGPVVDTYELELGSGVKVSKVTSSAQDLSLALYGAPIRIVYPMRGRTTIGIEVPRSPREIIFLDEVLSSAEFTANNSNLPVAMGKDAFGQTFVVDLTSMPHMLVAGSTGAGKSVFINTLLVSLLVKKSPRQMKLILIDPKQLELALYSKLPHLVMPVLTDAKRASFALLWAVQEMERRYSVLKELAVRNIEGFNEKVKTLTQDQKIKMAHFFDGNTVDLELPYIVIIIDEFADLILTKFGKDIENNICRLAAKARASGIHLVIATQRPSVDVITGLIKSNFPTRVSFRVTTDVDSRTILNATGAEKLLGKGDMLYKYGVETTRVHASYVDEKEIEELTLKLEQFSCDFDESAVDFLESEGELHSDEGTHYIPNGDSQIDDNFYEQAVQIVVESRLASASMLQRRLKIGYNRAANLIEEMEDKGIVGPAQGSKPRKVLVSPVASESL